MVEWLEHWLSEGKVQGSNPSVANAQRDQSINIWPKRCSQWQTMNAIYKERRLFIPYLKVPACCRCFISYCPKNHHFIIIFRESCEFIFIHVHKEVSPPVPLCRELDNNSKYILFSSRNSAVFYLFNMENCPGTFCTHRQDSVGAHF